MKETDFIAQNKKKWEKFEKLSRDKFARPSELADLYTDMNEDLSYAQTFYNKRTVRVYLNQTAQGIYNLVHKNRGESLRKLLTVWKVSLPLEIYRARKSMFFAFCIFLFWCLLGVVSTHFNPNFPALVLSQEYLDMTVENINNNKPLNVYTGQSQLTMFASITWNNLTVAFYTFIFGIFFTVGTHIFIFKNGVMLGAFQYFFAIKGVLKASILGIWIHGSFEISAIILAGGAGITLGNGMLFPGSYTRLQSLQMSAKRGIKIMLSLVPFIVMAGFLESFVTRNYDTLNEAAKWAIILFSFSLMIGYYVVYPFYVARKYPHLVHDSFTPVRAYSNLFKLDKLRNFGQSFADGFSFYRIYFGRIFKFSCCILLPFVIAIAYFQNVRHYEDLIVTHTYDWLEQLRIIMGFSVKFTEDLWAVFAWSIILTLLFIVTLAPLSNQTKRWTLVEQIQYTFPKLPKVWLVSVLTLLFLFFVPWYYAMILVFAVPFIIQTSITSVLQKEKVGINISTGLRFGVKSYGSTLLTILVFLMLIFVFAQLIAFIGSFNQFSPVTGLPTPATPDLLDVLCEFITNVSKNYLTDIVVPANIVRQVVYVLFIFVMLPILPAVLSFIYFDLKEKESANGLKEEFKHFGKRKRNQETHIDFE